MGGTIKSRLNYAITQHLRIGTSKKNGVKNKTIHSVKTADNLRSVSNQFGDFMMKNYSEVKIKEITHHHVNAFLEEKANSGKCNANTMHYLCTELKEVLNRADGTFNLKQYNPDKVTPYARGERTRDIAMDRADLGKMYSDWKERNSRSQSIMAVELGTRLGLRINECAKVTTSCINLEKMTFNIKGAENGAKNGKFRTIKIDPRDYTFFANLKANLGENRIICGGVSADGLSKGIRDEMKRVGISEKYEKTTEHAIRKMWARERYDTLREQGKDDKYAWEQVKRELGHADNPREDLRMVYLGK